MSSDYGVKCKQCEEMCVPDNLRRDNAEHILKDVKPLIAIRKLLLTLESGYEFTLEFRDIWVAREIMEFLEKHENHEMVLVDEYGNEY